MIDDVDPSWPPPQPKTPTGVDGIAYPRQVPVQPTPDLELQATGQRPKWLSRNSSWVAALAGVLGVGVGALIVLSLVSKPGDQGPSQLTTTDTNTVATPLPATLPGSAQMPAPRQPTPGSPSGPNQLVQTQSGRVHCTVSSTGEGTGYAGPVVICEADEGFMQTPRTSYGFFDHYHCAVTDAAGNFSFQPEAGFGNRDNWPVLPVLYYGQTYHLNGWTINASSEGTRFINDQTGHGMFVSIENTYPF